MINGIIVLNICPRTERIASILYRIKNKIIAKANDAKRHNDIVRYFLTFSFIAILHIEISTLKIILTYKKRIAYTKCNPFEFICYLILIIRFSKMSGYLTVQASSGYLTVCLASSGYLTVQASSDC